MRFFVAFLFCFCFSFATANATSRGSQKWMKKATKVSYLLSHHSPSHSSKSGLLGQRILEELDLFQQNSNHPLVVALIWTDSLNSAQLFAVPRLSKTVKFKTEFSYHFIFSFLYPKHTFW